MKFNDHISQIGMKQESKDAAKDVSYIFLLSNRFLDTVKESLLIQHGLPHTSNYIHGLAHTYLEMLDEFGNILHQAHEIQVYPDTPELVEPIGDVDKAFSIAADVMISVNEALQTFITATKDGSENAMSLEAEELQAKNNSFRNKLLKCWQMWDSNPTKTSFDNWVKGLDEQEDDDDD